jgi:hypothetical protein
MVIVVVASGREMSLPIHGPLSRDFCGGEKMVPIFKFPLLGKSHIGSECHIGVQHGVSKGVEDGRRPPALGRTTP